MSISELRRHGGANGPPAGATGPPTGADASSGDAKGDALSCRVSCCGYAFEHAPLFSSHRGRDITQRNVLHHRGLNLDANDDGGVSPFPNLAQRGQHGP